MRAHLAGSLIVCLREYLILQFIGEKEKRGEKALFIVFFSIYSSVVF
jgi:hypothetical protein